MEEYSQNIAGYATIFSALVSVIVGIFMYVQSTIDKNKKWAYLWFSTTWFYLALCDGLVAWQAITHQTYEFMRIIWTIIYLTAIIKLFEIPYRTIQLLPVIVGIIGLSVWSQNYLLATSINLPLIFFIAGCLHGNEFKKNKGFASAMLCGSSFALSLSCMSYYPVLMQSQVSGMFPLVVGYIQYSTIATLSVVFGWIYFPRELRMKAPVKISKKHAFIFITVLISTQIIFSIDLLNSFKLTFLNISTYAIQLTAFLTSFYFYKNSLGIFTDNVEGIINERTDSLKKDRKKLHQEIKNREEVIERQKRVEMAAQIAGETAHDIQNRISPIFTYTREIEKRVGHKTEIRDFLIKIRNQAEDLLDLNNQLLTLSRRGRVEQNFLNLLELIESMSDLFLGCDLIITGHKDAWVSGSWAQLSRAIQNLITNAFDVYRNRPGTVEVSCGQTNIRHKRNCHLGILKPGSYSWVRISDQGHGITSHDLERIFEPYYSTKTTGKLTTKSGTGLGLSIVLSVVDDHKGILDLKTNHLGTVFTLYFPAIENPVNEETMVNSLGSEVVLIADDDDLERKRISKWLERAGYLVIPCADGKEAVMAVEEQQVDLAILDYEMPIMNGQDTCFAIKHLRSQTKMIVYSGFLSKESKNSLCDLGVSAFLDKPTDPRRLLQVMREALDSQCVR